MAKVNIREINPARYAKIKSEQDALRAQCGSLIKLSRLCPYCEHKVENIAKGSHGYAMAKCPHCGEEVIFPPISFRLAR